MIEHYGNPTNDCVEHSKRTLTWREGGSVRPCGCVEAARWASVREGEVYPPFSFLALAADGVLEPWTAADQRPVAVVQVGFDTTAETAPISRGVYFMSAGVKIQTDALVLPAGVDAPKAKTILRANGAELLDLTGAAI